MQLSSIRRDELRFGHRSARWESRIGAGLAAGVVAAATLLGASAASAEPSIPEKRRQAESILAQVQDLDAEVGAAAERFNGANYKLGRLGDRLQETRTDLTRARRQLGTARGRAGERLVQLYVNGSGPSTLEVMLGSASLSDMLDRLEIGQRVLDQDTRIAADLKQLTLRTKQRERQLAASRAKQARFVSQLGSERRAIAAKLSERRRLLSSIQAEVAELEAAERARQIELRRRAEAQLARQRSLAAEQARRTTEPSQAPASPSPPAVTADPAVEPPAAPEPPTPPAPPADAGRGAQVVAIAMRYLGVPYKWGGASPSTGFDCSGLTMYVFAQIGVSLPHYAAAQYGMGRAVSKSELQAGDLVFFRGLGHMGMYIGGGNFIHAPRTGDVVKISSIYEPYRVANWVGARRVL